MTSTDSTPLLNRHFINPYKRMYWFKSKHFYLNLFRRSIAEFIGTALYVFAGATSVSNFVGNEHPHLPTVALTFGFSYAGLSAAMMHVSGGHLNPAITVGVFIAGGINVLATVVYFISQLVGGVVGAACVLAYENGITNINNNSWSGEIDVLYSSDGHSVLKYAATEIPKGVGPGMGILIEMLLTLMLVMVFIHTSMEKAELKSTSPALCGLTLAAGILAGYRLTGGSMNPARSFGPPAVGGDNALWEHHYVYWIGPLLGGILAGGIYRLLLSSKPILPLVDKEIQENNHSSTINHNIRQYT